MTTEELIKKIYVIVQYWHDVSERGEDNATNSAAWSYYHGSAEAYKRLLTRLQQGEETIEKIYQNVKYL